MNPRVVHEPLRYVALRHDGTLLDVANSRSLDVRLAADATRRGKLSRSFFTIYCHLL